MEFKHFAFEEFKAEEGSRKISGYGSIFKNVDSYGDIVMPGAFARTLKERRPAMLWQHQKDKIPGVWDLFEERGKGLYLEGTLADTPLGEEAYKLARMGAFNGLSIGYSTKKWTQDDKGIRQLEDVELFEVSLVTFPANERARVTGVKSAHENEREFEDFLREAGYSREAAKIVASRGFKALSCRREAGADGSIAAAEKVAELLTKFKL